MGNIIIKVPITKSARQYGYIIWNKRHNPQIEKLLLGTKSIPVHFNKLNIGKKNIDWKYHRISLGWGLTRPLSEKIKIFVLTIDNNILKVSCE